MPGVRRKYWRRGYDGASGVDDTSPAVAGDRPGSITPCIPSARIFTAPIASRGPVSSARWTTIDPALFAPTSRTQGVTPRGIGFIERDRPSHLIVELVDEFARAGHTYLLRLHPARTLRGVVVWLSARSRWRPAKRLSPLPGRLWQQIAYASPFGPRPASPSSRAALQPFMATRAFDLGSLRLLKSGKLLVAILYGGLCGPSADEYDALSIRGGEQRIHSEVHPRSRVDWGLPARWSARLQMRRTTP